MKKSAALLLLVIVLLSLISVSVPLAISQDEDLEDAGADIESETSASGFEAAYNCLEDSVKQQGYSSLTSEEQAFSLLALSYDEAIQGELRTALADSSLENRCWPSRECRLKDTAIALIALNRIQQSTNTVENWLIEKTTTPSGLNWFLQIDSDEETDCTISYGTGSKEVTIHEDKKITGASGDCLSSALGGYWIEVDEDCYDKTFEVSCDKEFITSLSYKKSSGTDSPFHISSITHSAPANSKTTEKVNSLCFKESDSSSCSYEGSLWAALSLKKMQKDISPYLPYLIAMAPSQKNSLPSAFLFMLTGDEEYFTELINEQRTDGYWQTSSSQSSRYFDTALGLLALQDYSSSEQAEAAESWLLENQPASGCWGNIRDTSFILYAASPKNPKITADISYCEDSGYYCVPTEQDCEDVLGDIKANYYCSGLGQTVCCTVEVEEELPASEPSGEEDCIDRGYDCRLECQSDEEEVEFYSPTCPSFGVCCRLKPVSESEKSYWWIWLLVILIILLALAIIFRNQLKVWVFRIKNKFKKGPVTAGARPLFPPRPPAGGAAALRMMPRRMFPPGMMPGQRRLPPGRPGSIMPRRIPGRPPARTGSRLPPKPFPKEGALQETLKKLREMGR